MPASVTLYRALMRMCPREFRNNYGDQAVEAFAEYARCADRRGLPAAWSFAAAAYSDILMTALREHATGIGNDVAYALRLMAKSWVSSAIVVVTLAIAIGIGATVFSAIEAVLLAPLPYADSTQLVFIFDRPFDQPAAHGAETSLPNALDWPHLAKSFSAMGSYANWNPTRTGASVPQALPGQVVTGDFFRVLGVRPRLGRILSESDARPGAPHTIVISESYWREAFGAASDVVGKAVLLNDISYRVVGVLPGDFAMPRAASLGGYTSDVFRALPSNASDRDSHYLITVARLRAGVSQQAAQADMDRVAGLLRARFPIANANLAEHVVPMSVQLFGSARLTLAIALAAVVGIVLIACLNVSNILLGRIAERERELAVRLAVGASRRRLIGQLLVESAVFAAAGGTLGLGLCGLLVRVLPALGFNLPRIVFAHVTPNVLLFTLAVTCACAIVIGTLPALTLTRSRISGVLEDGGRGGSGARGKLTRSATVVLELALALTLVTGSGLLVRSFIALSAIDIGLRYDDVIASNEIMLPLHRYPTVAAQLAFAHALVRSLQALPDVESPGLMVSTPLSNENYNAEEFRIEGHPRVSGGKQTVEYNAVTPGALRSLRVHLLRGRLIDDQDTERSAPVAIVTKAFARQKFPSGNPLGQRIVIAYGANPPWGRTIVGVVDDFKMESLTEAPMAQVVVPLYQDVTPTFQIVGRTHATSARLASEISLAVRSIDRDLPARHVNAYAAFISGQRSSASTAALLLGFIALVGLLLAGLGTYGVVAYNVGQRAREFGIRRALGANAWTIASSVLVQVVSLSGAGIVLGFALSAAGSKAISALLYRVSPFDPLTFAVVAVTLLTTALGAAAAPALRATRVDPMATLRHD
jgi:putative ABC transport system permease protein